MKIGMTTTTERPTRAAFGPPQPPAGLDDLGLAQVVIQAPTTEAAWAALTDRLPKGGAYAAARLAITLDRVNAAGLVVAGMLPLVAQQREAVAETKAALVNAQGHVDRRTAQGLAVPPSWTQRLEQLIRDHITEVAELGVVVDRLAELVVEEYDALVAWDDAAHRAALLEPRWVEVPPGERPIPAEERSWVRCARLVARAVQAVPGDAWSDAVHDALALIDPYREPGDGEAERIKQACRTAVRDAIKTTYAQETSG